MANPQGDVPCNDPSPSLLNSDIWFLIPSGHHDVLHQSHRTNVIFSSEEKIICPADNDYDREDQRGSVDSVESDRRYNRSESPEEHMRRVDQIIRIND